MITWMQRHKKYLIVTIWISTIAFIGAGFVGWGQYSYGDKAGAVAKVGEIEISQGELQKSYSNLYSQYNKMFQGNFDEEKAKQFGLQKQALNQLTQQALILNLARSYNLQVSDDELLAELKTQKYFFNNGVFNKEVYKQVLSRNNLTMKEYEDDVKKELLMKKTLKLLPVKASENELAIFDTLGNIADKLNYKVLTADAIKITPTDKKLKTFWETKKADFSTEVTYDIEYIKQEKVSKTYEKDQITSFYADNKNHFKDSEGKIKPLAKVKEDVLNELNMDSTKNRALRTYISFKKNKLTSKSKIVSQNISATHNPYNHEVLSKIAKLSITSPFLKPVLVNGEYFIIKLLKVNESHPKTFEQAKADVLPLYVSQTKKDKLLKLADASVSSFKGTTTDFITIADSEKLSDLSQTEAKNFLEKLFVSKNKNAYVVLDNGKIVLYNILEQRMLTNKSTEQNKNVVGLKSNIFNQALITKLQNRYKTEIFVKGL